jgi:hypothetical protein
METTDTQYCIFKCFVIVGLTTWYGNLRNWRPPRWDTTRSKSSHQPFQHVQERWQWTHASSDNTVESRIKARTLWITSSQLRTCAQDCSLLAAPYRLSLKHSPRRTLSLITRCLPAAPYPCKHLTSFLRGVGQVSLFLMLFTIPYPAR